MTRLGIGNSGIAYDQYSIQYMTLEIPHLIRAKIWLR